MGVEEAKKFIRKHMPLIIKDKNGNPQFPFKSVNAYEQVCKHLAEQLAKNNDSLEGGSELSNFKEWFNNLPEESDDRVYITDDTISRFKSELNK